MRKIPPRKLNRLKFLFVCAEAFLLRDAILNNSHNLKDTGTTNLGSHSALYTISKEEKGIFILPSYLRHGKYYCNCKRGIHIHNLQIMMRRVCFQENLPTINTTSTNHKKMRCPRVALKL